MTIENINWHLEQGKDVEPAILDGAQQIVMPAFVSLLCICIVFVPMFLLGGVAGYLFVPLAEAVVFAMIGSFILSRTLVPTMAQLPAARAWQHASSATHGMRAAPRRRAIRLMRFQQRLRDALRRGPRRAIARCWRWRCAHRKTFIAGFLACRAAVVRAWRRSSARISSRGRCRPDPAACARASRAPASRRPPRLFDHIEQTVREIIPPDELDNIVDNIGLPFSGINLAYQQHRRRSARRTATS